MYNWITLLIYQKLKQHCKLTILQLKKKKNRNPVLANPHCWSRNEFCFGTEPTTVFRHKTLHWPPDPLSKERVPASFGRTLFSFVTRLREGRRNVTFIYWLSTIYQTAWKHTHTPPRTVIFISIHIYGLILLSSSLMLSPVWKKKVKPN